MTILKRFALLLGLLAALPQPGAAEPPGTNPELRAAAPGGLEGLRAAVQRDPSDPELHVRLGDAYFRARDGAAALQEYRTALDLKPADADTRVKLGTLLVAGGRFEEAEAEASKAAVIAPSRPEPLSLLGRARAGLGRWEEAADAVQRAIRIAPDEEALRVQLSSIYALSKDSSKAEEALRAGLEAIPPSRAIRGALIDLLTGQGRFTESDDLVRELLNLGLDDRQLHRTAALYYLRRGNRTRAETLFKRELTLAGADTASRVEALADLSNFHWVTGNLQAAEANLEESRALAPENSTTLSRLANLYLLTNDVAKAEPLVEKLSEKASGEPHVRVLKAQLDLARGRASEAQKALESVLDSAPEDSNARFYLGKAYVLQRRWDEALGCYQRVVGEVPNHFFANLELAKVYLAVRRPSDALDTIDKVLKMQPDSGDGLRVRANALLTLGRAQEAEAAYRDLIPTASGTDLAALHLRLGQALESQNRLGEAFGSYAESSREAPTAEEPVLRQLSLLDRLGKGEEADRAALDFLSSAGDSAPVLLTLATRALARGDTPKAEEFVTRAAKADGGSPAAKELEGRIHLAAGDEESARTALDEALLASPDRLSALLLLSGLLEKQGKSAEARATNEHILRLDPKNVSAANNLAVVYAEDASTRAEALRLARLAAAQAPGNPMILDTLGWVQYRMGNYQEALKNLEAANRLLPDQPEVAFHLAAAYVRAERREEASPLLQFALEKAPQAPWAEEARSLAAEIDSFKK